MKMVKFGMLALTMGLFIASCGNGENKTVTEDSTNMTAPADMPAPAPVDTMTPVATDTSHMSGGVMDTMKK